jgi:hypothetical protein
MAVWVGCCHLRGATGYWHYPLLSAICPYVPSHLLTTTPSAFGLLPPPPPPSVTLGGVGQQSGRLRSSYGRQLPLFSSLHAKQDALTLNPTKDEGTHRRSNTRGAPNHMLTARLAARAMIAQVGADSAAALQHVYAVGATSVHLAPAGCIEPIHADS